MSTLNLTWELKRLIADIAGGMAEFSHIDPQRLLVCIATTRNGGIHGTYAKIHPLRFEDGSRTKIVTRRRQRYSLEMPAIVQRGTEMLYVIYFLVPRFLELSTREKLITVFHELYHISPAFNGDIRRFPGRNYAHGSSTRRYNALMGELVDSYLCKQAVPDFLNGGMEDLRTRHTAIVGRKLSAPRITIKKGSPN